MYNNELEYEKILKIKTCGRDDTDSDLINYPYEPTSYKVLERLSNSGYIRKKNYLLDYGSGKGRVDFFMSYQTGCKCKGIELNERIYNRSIDNLIKCKNNKITFLNINALDYKIEQFIDRIYFFNPFSTDILSYVLEKIKESKLDHNRTIYVFFYYISKSYIELLNNYPEFKLVEVIDCTDLFEKYDELERIFVYEI